MIRGSDASEAVRDWFCSIESAEAKVQGTGHTASTFVHDMGADHRRVHAAMPQQFLHRADVVTTDQVRREGMAQRVTTHQLGDTGRARGYLTDSALGSSTLP